MILATLIKPYPSYSLGNSGHFCALSKDFYKKSNSVVSQDHQRVFSVSVFFSFLYLMLWLQLAGFRFFLFPLFEVVVSTGWVGTARKKGVVQLMVMQFFTGYTMIVLGCRVQYANISRGISHFTMNIFLSFPVQTLCD